MDQPKTPAVQDLINFGTEMQNSELFDEEDLGFWRDALAEAERADPAIAALSQTLPQRQQLLAYWDSRFQLSQHYPDMMRKFAQKDAELYQLLQSKLQNQLHEARRY